MAKKKLTKAEIEAARRRARANTERLRQLAERGLAELERDRGEPIRRPASNAEWLRELAEKAQAELDTRKQRGT
jgi:hypothetical protein